MFKLYKRYRPLDLVFYIILIALTVGQVYFSITLIDYVQGIIKAISNLNMHNNTESFGVMGNTLQTLIEMGWDNIPQSTLATMEANGVDIATIKGIVTASEADIWYNGGMMLLFAGLSALCQTLVGVIAARMAARLSTILRHELYEKVNSFSLSELNKFSTASLITRATNDIQQIQIGNIMILRMAITAPITAIWAIVKINASSFELTLATIVAIVLLVISITAIIVAVLPKFKVVQKLTDKINNIGRESLTGIRVVRAYNAEKYQEDKFEIANEDLTKTQLFTGRVMALLNPIMVLVMNGINLIIYWIGASLINKGEIDYATVTSFMMLTTQIVMSFMMLMMMFILIPRAQVSAMRVNEVLDTIPSITDSKNPINPTEKGSVEFKNVSFGYNLDEEPIIKDISFKVTKGQTVAFIGATGSGKTSVINLIPRFYDVTSGEVLVDGVNVKDIRQEELHKIVSYVPQKAVLFSGSVKENIAFGNPNLNAEEIVDAAKIAEADDFVSHMESGYESHISQGGKNVSGGQKQRLSIARAIAMKPEIIIFDDSFSALDYKTDRKIRDNLKESMQDVTKVIVAQRIGTIMDADLILVLEDGIVVGSGKHSDLIKSCEVYKEIALSQLSKEELGL